MKLQQHCTTVVGRIVSGQLTAHGHCFRVCLQCPLRSYLLARFLFLPIRIHRHTHTHTHTHTHLVTCSPGARPALLFACYFVLFSSCPLPAAVLPPHPRKGKKKKNNGRGNDDRHRVAVKRLVGGVSTLNIRRGRASGGARRRRQHDKLCRLFLNRGGRRQEPCALYRQERRHECRRLYCV
jgi:hypothetical protein